MSDLYTEVLVKKQQTGKDKAIKGVLIFFTVLFAAAGIMMNPLILLLALVLGIVDYIFIPKLSVEFEYLYVNGELDIDRIYSQSRRKRAASYELSNMEILAPYQSHQPSLHYARRHRRPLRLPRCQLLYLGFPPADRDNAEAVPEAVRHII